MVVEGVGEDTHPYPRGCRRRWQRAVAALSLQPRARLLVVSGQLRASLRLAPLGRGNRVEALGELCAGASGRLRQPLAGDECAVAGLPHLSSEPLLVADDHEGTGRNTLQRRHHPGSHSAMVAR